MPQIKTGAAPQVVDATPRTFVDRALVALRGVAPPELGCCRDGDTWRLRATGR